MRPTRFSGGCRKRKTFGNSLTILAEARAALEEHAVKSVAMADRIIGCPHEEGTDYPEGQTCPRCPFWASRDRWTGERLS